jgi:hypothetical protein
MPIYIYIPHTNDQLIVKRKTNLQVTRMSRICLKYASSIRVFIDNIDIVFSLLRPRLVLSWTIYILIHILLSLFFTLCAVFTDCD